MKQNWLGLVIQRLDSFLSDKNAAKAAVRHEAVAMKSRRLKTRIPMQLEVHVRYGDAAWQVLSKDISAGGLLIENDARHPLPVGAIVQVQVESAYDPPPTTAKVVRVTPKEIALTFTTGASV